MTSEMSENKIKGSVKTGFIDLSYEACVNIEPLTTEAFAKGLVRAQDMAVNEVLTTFAKKYVDENYSELKENVDFKKLKFLFKKAVEEYVEIKVSKMLGNL